MKPLLLVFILTIQSWLSSGHAIETSQLSQYLRDSERITAHAESDKYIWIGTYHGVYSVRKKDKRVFHLTCKNSVLSSDTVTCIAVRHDGETFIGTTNGILRYDNYSFLPITTDNSSLKCNRITAMVATNSDDIYVGTCSGGVSVFSGSNSRTFTTENSPLRHNSVSAIKKLENDAIQVLLANGQEAAIRNRQFLTIDK